MQNKFIMMSGLPGSGKSTYASVLAQKESAVLHASDDLREALLGDASDQTNNLLIFDMLLGNIRQDLAKGKNVVYDATNLGYKKRKTLLSNLHADCRKMCCFIATPYEKCILQNNGRSRKVPEDVIERMYRGIFVPQHHEGWDDIEIIFNGTQEVPPLAELMSDLDSIPQDNPFHTLSIGQHCRQCMAHLERQLPISDTNADDAASIVLLSALMHDIGKKFTKRFEDMKGRQTDIAHYYGHENVSAYMSLFYSRHLPLSDALKVAAYIQWHMQPMQSASSKAVKKMTGMFGQAFYDDLLRLHNADILAK